MNAASEREYSIFKQNQRTISERKRELDLILRGQLREAVYTHAGDILTNISPVRDVAELYRNISGTESAAELCSAEFALLCLEYVIKLRKTVSLKSLLQNDEPEAPAENGKTVYMQNSFTDMAYRIFSGNIKGLTASYSQSYVSSCEDVYYGRSTYVILPVYNSADGRLASFNRMLTKYDLKISSACNVDLDNETSTRYVLARKGLTFDSPEIFDMSVVLPDGVSPVKFLAACEIFGASAVLINSVPHDSLADSYGLFELNVQFSIKDADITAFLLFMEASHIRYTAEGLYKIYSL